MSRTTNSYNSSISIYHSISPLPNNNNNYSHSSNNTLYTNTIISIYHLRKHKKSTLILSPNIYFTSLNKLPIIDFIFMILVFILLIFIINMFYNLINYFWFLLYYILFILNYFCIFIFYLFLINKLILMINKGLIYIISIFHIIIRNVTTWIVETTLIPISTHHRYCSTYSIITQTSQAQVYSWQSYPLIQHQSISILIKDAIIHTSNINQNYIIIV